MLLAPKRVLFFSPHTDDIEIGCGGVISKLLKQGTEIFVCVFSDCKESVPVGYSQDILKTEFYNSMKKFGILKSNIIFLDYKVRYFSYNRQDILDDIVKIGKKINPDLVFCHSTFDVHQDHQTITNEVIRYFKNISIFGYELNWNNLKSENQIIVELDESDIEKKIEALNCYNTQKTFRKYFNDELIWSFARVNGVKINKNYAESFEAIRLVY